MSKFKVGDKARVKYVRTGPSKYWEAGAIVTVSSLGSGLTPLWRIPYECEIVLANGEEGFSLFEQLEPIAQELSTWKEIQKIAGWQPNKVGSPL